MKKNLPTPSVSKKIDALKSLRKNPVQWMEHIRKNRKHSFKIFIGPAGYKVTMIVRHQKYGFELHACMHPQSLELAITNLISNYGMHNLQNILTKKINPVKNAKDKNTTRKKDC